MQHPAQIRQALGEKFTGIAEENLNQYLILIYILTLVTFADL